MVARNTTSPNITHTGVPILEYMTNEGKRHAWYASVGRHRIVQEKEGKRRPILRSEFHTYIAIPRHGGGWRFHI